MAEFICKACGAIKEGRCKPKVCIQCGQKDMFEKIEPKDEKKK